MNVRIHQTGTSRYFALVEEGVWHFANGGTWTACEGQLVLKMGGSGTSGLLRFSDGADIFFIVALGIHNYKPWLDISPDLASDDTVVAVHSDWYKDESERGKNREAQTEKIETKDKKGNVLSASISKSADAEFWVTIVIGQEKS
ncbi:hypothetical protein EWM64_g2108 [Hericium alpestre]|uniref:Uncharacterized protein n=1 Tax=Hericium alpestre TaxID=135208 RepID=A0A4Z0A5A4_9AGAM|nr:hypothetical protein EWM64_g2108 [Hericium alpestre]